MISLLEELKNNFTVKQLSTNEDCTRVITEWFDTHDKAVNAIIKLLKDKGLEEITLPNSPIPYIIHGRDGNCQGVVPLCK